ncbi:MAG: hypothetical protein J7M09_04590 [Deltaproteobacteria bacterium]|nr:hypothetical protein [Candidatus Tharpella sp.]
MVKRVGLVLAVLMLLAIAIPALAADVKIKGDFNNRFAFTNHRDWLTDEETGTLDDGSVNDFWGEAKYRLWIDATTNDGKVKGVWAFEVGALEYGDESSGAGGYSGDGKVYETRWLYTDFQLPWACDKARIRMGLQPFKVSSYLWAETAMGVVADIAAGPIDLKLGWIRPWNDPRMDEDSDNEDMDFLYVRTNFKPVDGTTVGLYALYGWGDDDSLDVGIPADNYFKKLKNSYQTDMVFLGLDGNVQAGIVFADWDFIYENGSIDDVNVGGASTDYDVSAYFLRTKVGVKLDKLKIWGNFWYASGDDDPTDHDMDAYMAIDVDVSDNVVIFEGATTDDDCFTPRPYLEDKGFIMCKLAADYKASKKLSLGGALMYMMTAEDIEYVDNDGELQKEDEVGFEVDAYMTYKLYDNLEFAVKAGYLFSGDALDYYEIDQDGSSDEDIFVVSSHIRYKF